MRCALALALAALSAMSAARADALDELLQRFAAHPAGHAAFTEVHEFRMLRRPLVSTGELRYRAPDYLEKHTLQPRAETLRLQGGTLSVERGRHRRVLELAAHPELVPYIESLRATLAGDRAALERYFAVQVSGSASAWTLRLTPRPGPIGRTVAEVRLSGAADAIRAVEIRLKDGDRSRVQIGPDLPP